MRRPVLLTLAAVGGVIMLLGGTGIFAALSDTARSGTNSIETGALAPSADLQIAVANNVSMPWTCGPFTDDLTSPVITFSDTTGQGLPFAYCLRNIGSQTVNVTVQVEQFSDLEIGCTGDESLYDTTCQSGEQGELGNVARAEYEVADACDIFTTELLGLSMLRDQLVTPFSLGSLGPGATRCFTVAASPSFQNDVERQQVQSDRLTWRFAWTGQV